MPNQTTVAVRIAFSERLKSAFAGSGVPESPTRWQTYFNARNPDLKVTVHAARKWMVGEAIPSHPKLLALARMLDVEANWLLFGEPNAAGPSAGITARPGYCPTTESICALLGQLELDQRLLVEQLVKQMRRARPGEAGSVAANATPKEAAA